MKITEKLKLIEQEHTQATHVLLTHETLIELFGDNYQKDQVTLNNNLYFIPFEEDKTLYYILIFREGKDLYLVQEMSTGLCYLKTDNKFCNILYGRKTFYEKRIPQKKENSCERILFEKELMTLNELLAHPSMRLHQLFR